MRISHQYRCALLLTLPLIVACSNKKQPPPEPQESPAQVLELPDPAQLVLDTAVAAPEPLVGVPAPLPAAKPIKPPKGRKKTKKSTATKTAGVAQPVPVKTLADTSDPIPPPHPVSLPMLPEELMPFILALYHQADSLVEINPELAMVKINKALRYCDDGAFYTLAARIVCKENDVYRCQVLAERGFLKPADLNPNAHSKALRLLIQALQSMGKEYPSSNIEAQYNRAVLTYQLRYQKNPEDGQ